jgi:hypothetical protein
MAFEWRRLFENVASSIVHVDQRCNTKDVGRASAGRVDKAAARSFDDLLTHFWGHARKKCEAGEENSHGVVERNRGYWPCPKFSRRTGFGQVLCAVVRFSVFLERTSAHRARYVGAVGAPNAC